MARTKKTKGAQLALGEPLPPRPVDAGEHLESVFRTYALYVIEDRAVPSVADGLKPVHRRLMWAAMTMSPAAVPGSPTVKNARITGETMSKFHPHGDAYDALVRLAQPWAMRVPLFDFQGNMGSPDFAAAASRYTESRLSAAGAALLAQVRDGTVPMIENYDGLDVEPEVLPAAYPNLLVNGSLGIAVGMASMIPCHNPREVALAAQLLIANPKATVDELLEVLPGPDYPDPCQVINADALADIYRSGSGQIRARGLWTVEEDKGRQRIVVTSLPYSDGSTGSSERFIADCVKAVNDGQMTGIDDVRNESAKGQTRIVVELAKGVPAEQIVAGLCRYTNLQVTNPVRMHALDRAGNPQMYNLRTMLEAWVQHRVECIERRSRRRIEAIRERLHLLDGLLAALLDIDAAIAIIRGSDDVPQARQGLMERFSIDETQATYILDLTLRRLTRLARVEIEKEHKNLTIELDRLEKLVASPTKLRRQVGKELDASIDDLFPEGSAIAERRTQLANVAATISTAATIVDTPIEVQITDTGYIHAGRKAPKDATVVRRLSASTASYLVAITDRGQLHRVLGATVPTDKATALPNVLGGLEAGERVLTWAVTPSEGCVTLDELADELLLITSAGTIKRIAGADLAGGDRKGGISIIKLDAGERLVAVLRWVDAEPYLLVTSDGQAIRFVPDDVRPMGRTAAGVRGIKLAAPAEVVGAIAAADGREVLLAHAKRGAKRVLVDEFPLQGRAGKGVRASAVTGRVGPVAVVAAVEAPLLLADIDGATVELKASAITKAARDAAPAAIRGAGTQLTAVYGPITET